MPRLPKLILLLAAALLSACQLLGLDESCVTQQCLLMQQQANPSRSITFWRPSFELRGTERIRPIPDELLEYVRLDNRLNGYPVNVTAAGNPEMMTLLRQAYRELPAALKKLMHDKLAGIFLVENLGSSGYTESILGADGKPSAAMVVLDVSLFERRANDWASWRDSTPFIPDPRYRIRTSIADESNNTVLTAVQYLLIHELAHAWSVGSDAHPDWYQDLSVTDLVDFPFTRVSWFIARPSNLFQSRFDNVFWQRGQLVFYRQPRIPAREIPATIANLGGTDFVSLYGSISPYEDFAETFTHYVHTELMGRPYRLEVLVDGVVEASLASCLRDRCQNKLAFMKRIFGQ